MSEKYVDLNADLGESFGRWVLGDDAAMLDVVTSANVACGFHAGDPLTLLAAVTGAAERGVTVGAQVELPRPGRLRPPVHRDGCRRADRRDHLPDRRARRLARTAGTRVAYVKPHGALYNTVVHHAEQAAAVVSAVYRYDRSLPVLGLPGSELLSAAQRAGLPVVREAFADRAYTPEGTLVPRTEAGAVLHDPAVVAARTVRLVTAGTIEADDGSIVRIEADSVCVHGDSPGRGGHGPRRPVGARGRRRDGASLCLTDRPAMRPEPRPAARQVRAVGDSALVVDLRRSGCGAWACGGRCSTSRARASRRWWPAPAASWSGMPPVRTLAALAGHLRTAVPTPDLDRPTERVTIETVYDGVDLDEVGELTGLGRDGVSWPPTPGSNGPWPSPVSRRASAI